MNYFSYGSEFEAETRKLLFYDLSTSNKGRVNASRRVDEAMLSSMPFHKALRPSSMFVRLKQSNVVV